MCVCVCVCVFKAFFEQDMRCIAGEIRASS